MNIVLLNDGFDREMVCSKVAKFLHTDFASHSGDWAYSRVVRKLLVEPYVAPGGYMIDYKFHVLGGKAFAVPSCKTLNPAVGGLPIGAGSAEQ